MIAVSSCARSADVAEDVSLGFAALREPEHSPLGIALARADLVTMPVLSLAEHRTGREPGSESAVADSAQTLICSSLSAALLTGLLLNLLLGRVRADSGAALVVVTVAIREGVEAWCGEACAVPVAVSTGEREHEGAHAR